MLKGYCLSLLLIMAWVIAQIALFHLLRPQKKFPLFTALFILTLPAYIALYFLTPADLNFLPPSLAKTNFALGLANGLFIHGLLYCTYAEMFYYIDRPVTLRLLIEFLKAPEGRIELKDIQDGYSLHRMIGTRLQTMVMNGYLREGAGRYGLTPKGRFFARAFSFIRKILGVRYYLHGI